MLRMSLNDAESSLYLCRQQVEIYIKEFHCKSNVVAQRKLLFSHNFSMVYMHKDAAVLQCFAPRGTHQKNVNALAE